MYAFFKQAQMLAIAIDVLETISISKDVSLGGGIALRKV